MGTSFQTHTEVTKWTMYVNSGIEPPSLILGQINAEIMDVVKYTIL